MQDKKCQDDEKLTTSRHLDEKQDDEKWQVVDDKWQDDKSQDDEWQDEHRPKRSRGTKSRGGKKEQQKRKQILSTPRCQEALRLFYHQACSRDDMELLRRVFGQAALNEMAATNWESFG